MSTLGNQGKKSSSQRRKRSSRSSSLETLAKNVLVGNKLPEFVQEHRFHPIRRWRFDFAWPEQMIALEIEGGIFIKGRHTSPHGFMADCEKYNTATLLGWKVIRVTSPQIKSGELLEWIKSAFEDDCSL